MKKFGIILALLVASPCSALERIKIASETAAGIEKEVRRAVDLPEEPKPTYILPDAQSAPVLVNPVKATVSEKASTPIIPPTLPVVRALVGSKEIRTPYLVRDPKKGTLVKSEAMTVQYDYLLEGGQHITTTEKIKKAKDSRSAALAHPVQTRWALKSKRGAAFAAPFINILGSIAQVFTAFHH